MCFSSGGGSSGSGESKTMAAMPWRQQISADQRTEQPCCMLVTAPTNRCTIHMTSFNMQHAFDCTYRVRDNTAFISSPLCAGTCSNPPTSPALPANAGWNCAPSGITADGDKCSASCNPGYTTSGITQGICSGGGWTIGVDFLVCSSNGSSGSGGGESNSLNVLPLRQHSSAD